MSNNIKFVQCSSYDDLSKKTAINFIEIIKNKHNAILGLATGSSPIGTYKEMIKSYEEKAISFKECISFNLDEYIGLKKEYKNQSYQYFMNENLFSKIDINKKNTHFPVDAFNESVGNDFESYDNKIDSYGGMDILILGIGNNGHIGFNEPGSKIDSKTRMIDLTESTIKANSRFFDNEKDVPRKSVTMGLSTILKARKIVLVVVGDSKKDALNALRSSKSFDSNWPCTALVNHNDVIVYYIN